MSFIILVLADVLSTFCPVEGALAIELAVFELADVLVTVCPVEGALAIEIAVFELAFEFVAIFIVFDGII